MYILRTSHNFDSAHFLANYEGKCNNIHGHRWSVEMEVWAENTQTGGQLDGMVADFKDVKIDVKKLVDKFDHAFIIEEGSMREKTFTCLVEDNFDIVLVDFRPTAENFAKYFYDEMKKLGYQVKQTTVYETPNNCAIYTE